MTSDAGTLRPTASARRVAISSLASTRTCCGLFWNLTTHSRESAPSMSWLCAPPRILRIAWTASTVMRPRYRLVLPDRRAHPAQGPLRGVGFASLLPLVGTEDPAAWPSEAPGERTTAGPASGHTSSSQIISNRMCHGHRHQAVVMRPGCGARSAVLEGDKCPALR